MQSKNPFLKHLNKPFLIYFIESLALYFLFEYLYVPVTLGFNEYNYMVLGGALLIVLPLFQYFTGPDLLSRCNISHGITALSWALTYPLLFSYSYTKPLYFYEFYSDFLFGLTIFMLLLVGQYLATKHFKHLKIIAFLFTVFDFLLLSIPVAQIAYFLHVKHCISPQTLMALYMSNPQESFEYSRNAVGFLGLGGIVLVLIILFWVLYKFNKRVYDAVEEYAPSNTKHIIQTLSLIILFIYSIFFLFPQTCIIKDWKGVDDYMKEMQQYNTKHADIYNHVQLSTKETALNKVPGTIIMVIGESASRKYMHVYNQNFMYPDTPWETLEFNTNKNFTFFNNAYSAYVQTVPVLQRALTERNQYDDKPFLQSASILDIAKKVGYKTYWLSNQGLYGQYDTAIALIAKTADYPQWAHESFEFSDKYDGAILPLLKNINPKTNNFVVIHLMGSHIYYNDRYPSSFSIFKKTNPPTGVEAYANTILYTDHILKEIYNYGKENLNMQAMVYFSDHGESLTKSHNPDVFDFDMTRIPFWVYLSPQYQKAFPQTEKIIKQNEHQYFTNDLMYDFISGILQAPSNSYDSTRDFSNKNYKYNKNNLTTLLGTYKLTEDPEVGN